jgi:hypothetical protein
VRCALARIREPPQGQSSKSGLHGASDGRDLQRVVQEDAEKPSGKVAPSSGAPLSALR